MRILIVGGSSMVGKRLRERLSPKHRIVTAGRNKDEDFPFDLAAEGRLPTIPEPLDALVHCAASYGEEKADDWARNEKINGAGAFRVAELAASAGCKHLVYLSSLFAMEHPQNGYFGSYALSKKHGQENLAWSCARAKIGYSALQFAQIYDERGEARKHQRLFYSMIDKAARGEDITIHGKADPRRNFLFVEDAVTTIERVLEKRPFGIFPCLHAESPRLSEIAKTAFEVFGKGGRVLFDATKADPPSVYLPEDSRIYGTIGFSPATTLRSGIERIRDAKMRESA